MTILDFESHCASPPLHRPRAYGTPKGCPDFHVSGPAGPPDHPPHLHADMLVNADGI
jgi:hypothetical protein